MGAFHHRHACFRIWPLREGGAWGDVFNYYYFDAHPCAAGVFSPAGSRPISCPIERTVASAQGGRGPELPAQPSGRSLQRHTCLSGGCAHPFPQASCGMDYRGGLGGVDKQARNFYRDRAKTTGWQEHLSTRSRCSDPKISTPSFRDAKRTRNPECRSCPITCRRSTCSNAPQRTQLWIPGSALRTRNDGDVTRPQSPSVPSHWRRSRRVGLPQKCAARKNVEHCLRLPVQPSPAVVHPPLKGEGRGPYRSGGVKPAMTTWCSTKSGRSTR